LLGYSSAMKFDLSDVLNMPELPNYLEQVQIALTSITKITNPHIQKPVTRVITAPSKRLRSALVIASAGGKVTEQVVAACAAIELVHLGSLVHDDIMDNANTRWGIQTIHQKEGANQAILVGDYLFAKANQVAASVNPELSELIAASIVNLCDGQARELASLYDKTRTLSSYKAAIKGKTASLLSAACKAGALVGGFDEDRANLLGEFGEAFGFSFQLLDDILDLISTPALLGKPTASDIREGVYTMPVLLGLQGPQAEDLKAYLEDAKDGPLKPSAYKILQSPIQQTLNEVKNYNQKAKQSLQNVDEQLAMLPGTYTTWALSNLVADKNKFYIL
jgi:geranylgeranyl pyrophosphate synthase